MRSSTRSTATIAALTIAVLLAACARLSGGAGGSGTPTTAADAVRVALAQQDRFRGIEPQDENLIGQADWYQVKASGDGWEVLIRIGWGDCPAGCINEHRWTYAVGSGGSAQLLTETGDPLPGATGVRGRVTAGPTCPVERDPPDPACADRPVAGAVLIFRDGAGTEIARVTSDADGTFAVTLAPGSYGLTAEPVEGLMGTPGPMDVEVAAGQPTAELVVSYDTGIR